MQETLLHTAERQLALGLPFVIYRKPKGSHVKAILQNDCTVHIIKDYTEVGFVFAPYNSNAPTIVLKADAIHEEEIATNIPKTSQSQNEEDDNAQEKKRYTELVQQTVAKLKTGELKKVVLSRALEVQSVKPIFTIYNELLDQYPNALCYLWHHPSIGTWLGATPEILLKTEGFSFSTMALAGTQVIRDASKIVWANKEIEEQQFVTDYIVAVLKAQKIDVHLSDLETSTAGHLAHLRTKLSGRFKKGALKSLITALHPTPAVCGVPLQKAKQYISENENYDRTYYTGFLGELNFRKTKQRNRNPKNQEQSAYKAVHTSSELYVNLRCMQQNKHGYTIYVGGGITAASHPKNEWQETQSKAQTMLRLLDL